LKNNNLEIFAQLIKRDLSIVGASEDLMKNLSVGKPF
jgi:hypothetical protein